MTTINMPELLDKKCSVCGGPLLLMMNDSWSPVVIVFDGSVFGYRHSLCAPIDLATQDRRLSLSAYLRQYLAYRRGRRENIPNGWERCIELAASELETRVRGLNFATLRHVNRKRLPLFKNRKGALAHHSPDGSDWSDSDWLQALVGELGEYANVRKKMRRGDLDANEAKPMMADELADVMIYLDILAFRLGIDLGAAVIKKFNEVSRRIGVDIYIPEPK